MRSKLLVLFMAMAMLAIGANLASAEDVTGTIDIKNESTKDIVVQIYFEGASGVQKVLDHGNTYHYEKKNKEVLLDRWCLGATPKINPKCEKFFDPKPSEFKYTVTVKDAPESEKEHEITCEVEGH